MNWLKTSLLTKKLQTNQSILTKSRFWKQQTNGRRSHQCWQRELDSVHVSLEIHIFMCFVVFVIKEMMKKHQLLLKNLILLKNMILQTILGLKWRSLLKIIFYLAIILELLIALVFIPKKKVWSFLLVNTTLPRILPQLKFQMCTSFIQEIRKER